jgi:hypothetical protein
VFFLLDGGLQWQLSFAIGIEAGVLISTLDSAIIPTKAHQNNIARDELSIGNGGGVLKDTAPKKMFPEKMPLKKSMKHMGLTPPRGKYPGI